MAQGQAVPRKLVIGEAGRGHYFCSEAVGPVPVVVNGKQLPLLTRTIFAKQIHENIFSVPEACKSNYAMLFVNGQVGMYNPSDIVVKGKPILAGKQDPRTSLFYLKLIV